MKRYQWVLSAIALLATGNVLSGCTPGGVGDPCIPEDEYYESFAGYGVEEVNVEAMSFQCETRLCLVNHFQGRVTCPYGQKAAEPVGALQCKVPDGKRNPVKVDVLPQLLSRRASNSVYCSCRCDGPDKTARYCKCPSGYGCTLLNEIPLGAGSSQLLGSYCVRNGTAYNKGDDSNPAHCDSALSNCDYENCDKGVNPFGQECH